MNKGGGGDQNGSEPPGRFRRVTTWLTDGTNLLKALAGFIAALGVAVAAVIGVIQLLPEGDDKGPTSTPTTTGVSRASSAELEVQGRFNLFLGNNDQADLDTGSRSTGGSPSEIADDAIDLRLIRDELGDLYLEAGIVAVDSPAPSRWFTPPSDSSSGHAGCSRAIGDSSANPLLFVGEVPEGAYFCTFTNEGRISELNLIEADLIGGAVIIDYVTWELAQN